MVGKLIAQERNPQMPLVQKQTNAQVAVEERNHGRELPDLLAQLSAGNEQERRWAARDLAAYPQAIPDLMRILKMDSDTAVQGMIVTSLIRMKDPRSVDGLAECLREENVSLRNAAREALQHFPHDAPDVMRRLLSDVDPDIRIFAINVLQSFRDSEIETWLLDLIDGETQINVIAAIVEALNEMGSVRAKVPLEALKIRFSEEPYLCFAIDLALHKIGEI